MTTAGFSQTLRVKKMGDPLSDPADFVEKVNYMSGDWVDKITCDELKQKETFMTYFGSPEWHP